MTEHAPDLNATDARQARKGRRAFLILITSLALVVIAFTAVFLARGGDLSGHGGQERAPAQVAQNLDTTPSTVKQTAMTAPPGSVAAQAAGQRNANGAAGG